MIAVNHLAHVLTLELLPLLRASSLSRLSIPRVVHIDATFCILMIWDFAIRPTMVFLPTLSQNSVTFLFLAFISTIGRHPNICEHRSSWVCQNRSV